MPDLLETSEDGVVWLTLNRPDRLNAFSPARSEQGLRREASASLQRTVSTMSAALLVLCLTTPAERAIMGWSQ